MTPEELQERLDAQKWWDHYLDVLSERDRLRKAVRHVVNDSPGTPDSVKTYLLRALEGSWGEPYEQAMTPLRPEGSE